MTRRTTNWMIDGAIAVPFRKAGPKPRRGERRWSVGQHVVVQAAEVDRSELAAFAAFRGNLCETPHADVDVGLAGDLETGEGGGVEIAECHDSVPLFVVCVVETSIAHF